jgi:hypothetical protein
MFMYDEEFKHIAKYMDIYELLLKEDYLTPEDIKRGLMAKGVPEM